MPDTLSNDELRAIRAATKAGRGYDGGTAEWNARWLAHIDAMTAAVREADELAVRRTPAAAYSSLRAAVLAILGEPPADPDAEAEAEFLKPIKPQEL